MHEDLLELALPAQRLEAGAHVPTPIAALWTAGPAPLTSRQAALRMQERHRSAILRGEPIRRSAAELDTRHAELLAAQRECAFSPDEPAPILVVHALTGDMRVGGEGGWWGPLVGAGKVLDPATRRILCFNNLGSCYGTSGPEDESFPGRAEDDSAWHADVRGGFAMDAGRLPATITPWDQARLILEALDVLEVRRVHLVTGGSVGGMIVLCLALLDPERFRRVVPIASCLEASPWLIGFNHVARQMILHDKEESGRGLMLARQLAHMTYRAEPGLEVRQGRRQASPSGDPAWRAGSPYAVQTYLEYQGARLRERFGVRAYLAQLDAMDHHDIARRPGSAGASRAELLLRLPFVVHAVGIDSDALFLPEHMRALVTQLRALDRPARYHEIRSLHGHDAFLIEHAQVAAALGAAMAASAPDTEA